MIVTFLSNGVKAEIDCAGGNSFTVAIDGKERTFCVSEIVLNNLWSAMAWCKAHHLEIIKVSDVTNHECSPLIEKTCSIATDFTTKISSLFPEDDTRIITQTLLDGKPIYFSPLINNVTTDYRTDKTNSSVAVCIEP